MRVSVAVGYGESQQTSPGVWEDVITERDMYGETFRDSRRLDPPFQGQTLNDDVILGNSFSLLADPYALENYSNIRYVLWNGNYWEVTVVEVRRPRLIFTVGGLWNGNKA